MQFLSTPSARRATGDCWRQPQQWPISIHALREEGDGQNPAGQSQLDRFLSTPSARRATNAAAYENRKRGISIHALREEGDGAARAAERSRQYFYPRPPRGGRPERVVVPDRLKGFLSTPSARRATRGGGKVHVWRGISIHALREEGDSLTFCVAPSLI